MLFRHRMHRRVAGSDRYQWWVLWTVLAGLLSVNITFTVFVVALPQVARQLHTTVTTLTWTSTGPLLAFGVAAPILGKLGDLRGYKRLYLWGLSGAAVSVVLTASAPTAGVLIAARLFDGVQGAATGAASMALVLQAFSHEDRVKAMGWWALVGAGGPVLGVTIGAPIIQFYGWRALFWGELPLMAVAAVLAVVVLPSHDRAAATAAEAQARTGRAVAAGVGSGPRRRGRHEPPRTPDDGPDRAGRGPVAPARLGRVDLPVVVGDPRPARPQPGPVLGVHCRRRRWPCSPPALVVGVVLRPPRAAGAPTRSSRSATSGSGTSSSRSGPGRSSTSPTWAGSSSSPS